MHHDAQSPTDVYETVSSNLQAQDDIYCIRGTGLELYLLRDFLTPDECAHLIGLIDADKHPSTVMGKPPHAHYRTSESSPLANSRDPLIGVIDQRIAALTGIPLAYQEGVEGQRYAVGQQFMPHCDYFPPNQPYWARESVVGGQRTWTVMICLNTPEAGGGTMFPLAGVRMRPRAGNLLAWCNFGPNGELNPQSLHCGEPVEKGVKYILTKWHRERPFQPHSAMQITQPALSDYLARLIAKGVVAAEPGGHADPELAANGASAVGARLGPDERPDRTYSPVEGA